MKDITSIINGIVCHKIYNIMTSKGESRAAEKYLELSGNYSNEDINAATEANMTGNGHIKDQTPGIIDLGYGVKIDTNKISKDPEIPGIFQPNVGMPPQMSQPPSQPMIMPQLQPVMPPQIAQPPLQPNPIIPPVVQQNMSSTQPELVQQIQEVVPPVVQNVPLDKPVQNGIGRHKVDNPSKEKPITKKSDVDNVDIDLGRINIDTKDPKPPKQWPDTNVELPPAENVEVVPLKPRFNNKPFTDKYRYLGDIEKLALSMGIQIAMTAVPSSDGISNSGLIHCFVYTPESENPNVFKSFTIDTGYIIDRRAKMFPIILQCGYGYETSSKCYQVLIPKENTKEGSKTKNVLNTKVFEDLFIGGQGMISEKGLYNDTFLKLNSNVALITMPINSMDKTTRNNIRERLINAMHSGVFDEAKSIDPNVRFRFAKYDKKSQSFVLTSDGVPCSYCGPLLSKNVIEIRFNEDGTTVVDKIS